MNQDEIITVESLENKIQDFFGITLKPKHIMEDKIAFSRSSFGTIFLDQEDKLFVLITSQPKLSIGMIKKLLFRANLVYQEFLPPENDQTFFDEIATEKYKQTYPGLKPTNAKDLIYYKSLIKYDPILVEIRTVKDSIVKTFDPNAKDNWRPLKRLRYSKIIVNK